MAEVSSYPVAIPTRTENTIGVATLRGTQTNDATYSHALIHQQVGADVVAMATYIGTNASQTAPVANTVLYSGSNGVSAWSASPTLTTLTLSTDLIVDTNTFVVDGSDSRVYVGATSSAKTEILQVFGSARLQSTSPKLRLNETDGAADNKEWDFSVASEQLSFSIVNDADNASSQWLVVDRTGTTVDTVTMRYNRQGGSATAYSTAGTTNYSNLAYEQFGAITTSAVGTTTVNLPKTYAYAPHIVVSPNATTAVTATFSNVAAGTFDVDAWNDAGARVAVTVCWRTIGPLT